VLCMTIQRYEMGSTKPYSVVSGASEPDLVLARMFIGRSNVEFAVMQRDTMSRFVLLGVVEWR
jgi:hypothetical protein